MKRFLFVLSVVTLVSVLLSDQIMASSRGKILIVLSGEDHVLLKDGSSHPTGFFMSELATPLKDILSTGYDVVFANPTGKEAVMDKTSDSKQFFGSEQEYLEAKKLLSSQKGIKTPVRLSSLKDPDLDQFSAIFVPGGHAPMVDLYKDKDLGRILKYFHAKGRPTALICHGPVALLSAANGDDWPYKGYKMTVFSNEEENASPLGGKLKYSVQDELAKKGAVIKNANKPWESHAVYDRELMTGQNPMSDKALSGLLIGRLISGGSK